LKSVPKLLFVPQNSLLLDKSLIMSDPIFFKTYVRQDNTAVLTCPHCGRQKTILAESFKGYKHKLKVKCSCKNGFTAFLEFRNTVRKKTYLKGTYINHSRENRSGDLTTRDISVTGIAFSSLDIKHFKVGDELSIELTLDDGQQTEIKKKVIVKRIRKLVVGCEFEGTDEAFKSFLSRYLT